MPLRLSYSSFKLSPRLMERTECLCKDSEIFVQIGIHGSSHATHYISCFEVLCHYVYSLNSSSEKPRSGHLKHKSIQKTD